MVIRHSKHGYLIKKQFLEENEYALRFFFLENFRFFVSLIGIFLIWIYSNILNAWWKYHNSSSFFISFFFYSFFLLGTLVVKGMTTWCIATMWTVLTGFFWSKVVHVVPIKRKSFSQIWTILVLLAQGGSCCPGQRKRYESDWTILGRWKILLLDNVPLDINLE